MKQELADDNRVGSAIGLCNPGECYSRLEMYDKMCNELDGGEGRYCSETEIKEDFEKFGERQVQVTFENEYKAIVPETSECLNELKEVAS